MDYIYSILKAIVDHTGDISNVIATALAAYSIYLTVQEQKNLRKKEKVKSIAEQNLNWYNTVALNDVISNLNIYIDKSGQALDACKRITDKNILETELRTSYDNIKEEYKSLSIRISQLQIFSKSLYCKCNDSLLKIYDLYSEVINDALTKKYLSSNRERDIQDERIKIIKELYIHKTTFLDDDK